MYDVIVVGCGLSGAVMADMFARVKNKKVLIIEKRDHIGGNVYDYYYKDILIPKYGAHLFHTNSEKVWQYVNKYSVWIPWYHTVKAKVNDKLVPIPVNIDTVNYICNSYLLDEKDMESWLSTNQVKYEKITNSEEVAKSRIGTSLYEKLIKPYTFKQWNKYPHELEPSVLQRIPVRTNRDPRYFTDKYQALPKLGYTNFVKNIITHQNISVLLDTNFFDYQLEGNPTIIYTGPIDNYFTGMPKLEYRSIQFEIEYLESTNYYQPNSVINYPELNVPFTRIIEPKHFLNQSTTGTVIIKETSTDVGEPYYPVPTKVNQELYLSYKKRSEEVDNVHFLGRLANYKYFNMDEAILNSIEYFEKNFS